MIAASQPAERRLTPVVAQDTNAFWTSGGRIVRAEDPLPLAPKHYESIMAIGLVFWILVLAFLVFSFRRRIRQSARSVSGVSQPTPSQRLSSLLGALESKELEASEKIELERLVLHEWRSHFRKTDVGPQHAPDDETMLATARDRHGREVLGVLNDWLYNPAGIDRKRLLSVLSVRYDGPTEPT